MSCPFFYKYLQSWVSYNNQSGRTVLSRTLVHFVKVTESEYLIFMKYADSYRHFSPLFCLLLTTLLEISFIFHSLEDGKKIYEIYNVNL